MSHTDILQKLPESIIKRDGIFSKYIRPALEKTDELETVPKFIYDVNDCSGTMLDNIGQITGIKREGRNDEDYRKVVSNILKPPFGTMERVHSVIGKFTDIFTVTELCYPKEFEYEKLDGSKLLDETWTLDAHLIPKKFLFLDGTRLLGGSWILNPTKVRPASLEIDVGMLETSVFGELYTQLKKALSGITIYIKYYKEL